jgi:hypothetical protein
MLFTKHVRVLLGVVCLCGYPPPTHTHTHTHTHFFFLPCLPCFPCAQHHHIDQQVYVRAVGSLATVVVDGLLADAEALEDISSVQTQKLRALFEPVLHSVPQHFDKVAPGGAAAAADAAREHVAGWARFCDLYEVLDAGLRDIVAKHKAGGYALSAAELRGLIKAIFSNSELRAKCLAGLR